MPQGNPQPGEFYRHFKNKKYQIVTIAKHSETMEKMVVYRALYGDFGAYVRPYDMFVSEVDHAKYPEVKQKWRFELLADPRDEVQEAPEPETSAAEAAAPEPETSAAEAAAPEPETPAAEAAAPEPETPAAEAEAADPLLIRFMDAESFSDKITVFTEIRPQMTDKLLDEIAVVCDLVIPEGPLEGRYDQLKKCLLTKMKYERERNWSI